MPKRTTGCLLAALTALAAWGCSRPPPEVPAEPEVGPREVVQRIIELRRQRRYTELEELVVPKHAHEVVKTLMAVDDFLDANDVLCNWLRDNVGIGLSQRIDQSDIGNILGIFSRDVELLDVTVTGGKATVSFMVAGQLPAQKAFVRKSYGQWRYDADEGYSEHLPAAFHEMARGLEHVLTDLQSGRISRESLRDDPERLVDEVKKGLRRGVRLLSQARAEAEAGASPPEARP
jgi:hypothetical protein